MDKKLTKRFQNFENILLLFTFFKKTIKWLGEYFFNEKIEFVISECDKHSEVSNNVEIEKVCRYHKLLIKFNEIMNSQFFNERKKRDEFLNLY